MGELELQVKELEERVAVLEQALRSFMERRREIAIIEMGHIERALGLPRTKRPVRDVRKTSGCLIIFEGS